jgi:hypothetical protein
MAPASDTTPLPSVAPALAPIESLSPSTIPATIDVFATITYSIVVENAILDAIPQGDYESDLIDAMDILAVAVWSKNDLANSTGGRRLRNGHSSIDGRRLEVRIQIPTSVDAIDDTGKSTFFALWAF